MGNACGRNAKNQIQEFDDNNNDDELTQLKNQENQLKEDLENWRDKHQEEVDKLQLKLKEAEEEANILRGHGANSIEIKENSAKDVAGEIDNFEFEEYQLCKGLLHNLTEIKNDIESNEEMITQLKENNKNSIQELDEMLNAIQQQFDCSENIDEENGDYRRLAYIASYYRPIPKPKNISQLIQQLKLDCAESSSQTIQNLKALLHHIRTGDDSYYKQKPIRGIICQALKMGEKAHDKWSCDFCDLIDNSDLPMLA